MLMSQFVTERTNKYMPFKSLKQMGWLKKYKPEIYNKWVKKYGKSIKKKAKR